MSTHRQINHTPLRDALLLLGHTEVEGRMLYQDYLNIAVGAGMSRETVPPMSEQQWEIMCDMLGSDRPLYASSVNSILKLEAARKERETK